MEVAQNALAAVSAAQDADAEEFLSWVARTFRSTSGHGHDVLYMYRPAESGYTIYLTGTLLGRIVYA